jgi:hypothetical protein
MTLLLIYELKIVVANYRKEDFDDEQDLLQNMWLYF